MKRLIIFAAIILSLQDAQGQTTCVSCNGSTPASATGSNAIAAGIGSSSQGAQSVTIGSYDTAFLNLGFCIGSNLRDSGVGAILLGTSNYAIGPNSFIAGTNSSGYGSNTCAIGTNDSAMGTNSFAIGNFAKSNGIKSVAIGNSAITDSSNSIAIGTSVRSSGTNSMVLGSGISPVQLLQNNVSNSLMVGFNSTTPTLYVGPANGSNTTSVGIGTIAPKQMLDVNGNIAVGGIEVINNAGAWVGKPTGSRWYSGTTDAPPALGNDSDFYLNTTTDSVFEKLGTWTGIALIKGAQGLQGDSGRQGPPGATTLDTGSVFLGAGTTTSGADAFAIGTGVTASVSNSFVMGTGISNNAQYSFMLGFGSPLLVAGLVGGVVGGAGFVGIGATGSPAALTVTGTTSITGAVGIGGGVAAAGAILSVNGNASVSGTATVTGVVNANGGITVNNKLVIDDSGNAPRIVEEMEQQNASGDVTGTYTNLQVIKIRGRSVAGTQPSGQAVLQWDSIANQWAPSTLTIPTYVQGTGVQMIGDTINALVASPIWNANKLQRNAVSAAIPFNQQVLQWDSITNQWAPSTLTIPTYVQGTGVQMIGDTIKALVASPIWNANKLQQNAVSAATPASQQVLQWDSIASQWAPTTLNIPTYTQGAGVNITGDVIEALVDSPLWNANKLQRNAVSVTAPANQQVLQWNSLTNQWAPGNTGWATDSLRPDSILMYTTTKANVGIGTSHPAALLQVQGGHTSSTDSTFIVDSNGNVAIGTTNIDTTYKLSVRGEIRAMGVTVESDWADYVFDKGYSLMPLTQVEQYISSNGHLPGVLPAQQIEQQGLNIGRTQKMLMEKIEELTLYMIALQKENKLLTDKISDLQSKMK